MKRFTVKMFMGAWWVWDNGMPAEEYETEAAARTAARRYEEWN